MERCFPTYHGNLVITYHGTYDKHSYLSLNDSLWKLRVTWMREKVGEN